MKLKSLFLLGLASVASLLSSCVKEADINAPKFAAQIKASEDGIRHDIISVEGGELVVELLAGEAWSATVEPGTSQDVVDDITIEPASGSASSSIVEVVAKLPANKGYDRSVKVSFIGSTHSATVSFIQNGELGKLLRECTVSEFIKKPIDDSIYYRLTGEVGTITNVQYGRFNIIDPETHEEILIYGLGVEEDLSKQDVFEEYGIQEGDLITIASARGAYGATQEGVNSYYISHEAGQTPEPSFSVDGKQWLFEWQYNEEIKTTAVLDFGVYAEGQFTFAYDWSALDPESFAGISPVYQGTYVIDEENSKVTLSLASIFDEEYVLSGDITYSDVTETTAHFELAEVFGSLGIESADATVGTPEITDDPFIGGGEDEYYTLAEVADYGVDTGYQVKDVVVLASCNKRTIIADHTAFMFLFNDTTFEVGDVLTVSGDIIEYDGVLEWSNATVEVTSKSAEVTYPEVKAYGAEDFAQYVTSPVVDYVKFTAVHDGSKLWVGDTQIYLQNPTGLTPQAGEVEISGFTLGFSKDHNNVTVLVTSLEQKNYRSSIKVASSVSVNVGESVELGARSNSPAALSYVSADETVATVSAEGVVSGVKEGTTTITVSVPAEGLYSAASAEVSITVNASGTVVETVDDVLNQSFTGVTGNNYILVEGLTGTSGTVYSFQCAGGYSSIQLRSKNSNSGIVTTASGGKAVKVVVEWQSQTLDGRTLDVYGSNSAYTNPTELYSADTQGTKLGSIVKGTSTELELSGEYDYIAFRSNSDAMYITSITITYKK